jgi:hypothetical protein
MQVLGDVWSLNDASESFKLLVFLSSVGTLLLLLSFLLHHFKDGATPSLNA